MVPGTVIYNIGFSGKPINQPSNPGTCF